MTGARHKRGARTPSRLPRWRWQSSTFPKSSVPSPSVLRELNERDAVGALIAKELMALGSSVARSQGRRSRFLGTQRRRKTLRGARFAAGAVAATLSSRDRRLTSLRQLARIGKDDLRLALIITDLPGDADLHVDRLLTLLGKGYRRRKHQVGLTDGGREAPCWAGVAPLDENSPRARFSPP